MNRDKRILLVGWDAANWKLLNPLLDAGELPALNEIVERGVAGELLSCQPLDSAAVWTSIATGKRPWQHGIFHSREFDATNNAAIPISRKHREAKAVWEMLTEKRLRSVVVGWPATHGSEGSLAQVVSDRFSEPTAPPGVKPWPPAIAGTYSPESLRQVMDVVRVSPADIGADVISRYVPEWKKIDQKTDPRLGRLRMLLGPDFCHFAAAVQLMQRDDWEFAAVRFPALGHLAKIFLPFHTPHRPWIAERDFASYHDVVAVHCRALDQMLGTLRKLAGPEATVMLVSGFGTQSPDIPPTGFPPNGEWKSPQGLFAASGARIQKDALLHGATVLDVAPTVLTLLGQAIGEDMEGRVLVEVFSGAPEINRVESWETPPRAAKSTEQETSQHSIAQKIREEAEWNCAQSCLEAGQFERALPRLENLFRALPENADYCHALFQCQVALGRLEEAQTTLEVLLESVPPGVAALLPQAELALAKHDLKRARTLADEARRTQPTHPAALKRLGLLLLHLREWKTVAELAKAALKRDESDPIVWLGLAEASLRQGQPTQAEDAARRAIQLKYFLPDAHFIFARALVAQNKWAKARDALSALLKIQPDNKSAAGYNKLLQRNKAPDLT